MPVSDDQHPMNTKQVKIRTKKELKNKQKADEVQFHSHLAFWVQLIVSSRKHEIERKTKPSQREWSGNFFKLEKHNPWVHNYHTLKIKLEFNCKLTPTDSQLPKFLGPLRTETYYCHRSWLQCSKAKKGDTEPAVFWCIRFQSKL